MNLLWMVMVIIFWQLPKTSVPNEAMLAGTVTLVMVSLKTKAFEPTAVMSEGSTMSPVVSQLELS